MPQPAPAVAALTKEVLSALIGAIHDCAVEPDLWPDVQGRICALLHARASQLYIFDGAQQRCVWASSFIGTSDRTASSGTHGGESGAEARPLGLDLWPDPVKEPIMLTRLPPEALESGPPAGHVDVINLLVPQDSLGEGIFGVMQFEVAGGATDHDIRIVRLLAPHLRRAVTIGHLVRAQRFEARALVQALDLVGAGVGIVTADARLLHANAVARRMIDGDGPIRSAQGRLLARRPAATTGLHAAIAAVAGDGACAGVCGVGVPLGGADEAPAMAHILPLGGGEAGLGPVPAARAVVFVTEALGPAPSSLAGIAACFALTKAETSLLALMLDGERLAGAAARLGISLATAKTHLLHTLEKTGTRRQADLLLLVRRLLPPGGMVGAPAGGPT